MDFEAVIRTVGTVVDVAGVAAIVVGGAVVSCLFVYRLLRGQPLSVPGRSTD